MILENYQFNYSWQGNKNKPVILFLHGFMGDRFDFEQVISLLSSSFSFLTVDLPGHGKTKIFGSEEYYTMSKTAQALIELLQKNQIARCFLVGYSLGGRLALYLTIYFPNYFEKVVLESASPGLIAEKERHLRLKKDCQLAAKLETNDFEAFLNQWYSNSLFNSFKKHRDFNQAIQKRLKNNPQELAKSLRNLSTGLQPSLWQQLKFNKIPLLFVVGELDQKFVLINTQMSKLCPNSQLKIIKNSGHNIHFENPVEYSKVIKNFLFK
ncbi:2-succinyl-6-hydroxy-2,4-cyclohexadiene-1-carboxylate synthase [Stanieria cyanosphaera PCC 7437]|uniref:Putative 2-succinyl-6-hydroxy-2,4-cyclohexadiene-1-carboxylate synthase n=1 Tax=Stanieria cyanosphaera (strain ATCC 29371 / PCC 7437) TaxID=111780 RepID=K9XRW1_STAC7|nr:2-succinyl-6-hydroxy-2,4-cyclohexadiene-1-carboxylate synthase [Stanieria cyanosphaera]AFZ35345.1 2-succinyl-6-hydroxy-2,4-cyclohexadiene-1-carboxylate synthase [Stanieria cyanosphaera PCC 7437]